MSACLYRVTALVRSRVQISPSIISINQIQLQGKKMKNEEFVLQRCGFHKAVPKCASCC